MAWWKRRKEIREATDTLLQALLSADDITKDQALAIPSVAECVEVISGIVAALPIRLYQDKGNEVQEITDDPRLFLLNDESGDLLDSFQMKKAWIEDYLLDGKGYLYINWRRNQVKSLHYVDSRHVSILLGTDPIFKIAEITINGAGYREFEFVRLVRRTKDGVTGSGIVSQNNQALAVMYNAMKYENYLVKTGGNKKGFLKAQKKMTQEAMDHLKANFRKYIGNDSTDNVMVLNEGLEFQEASNTSVDMQLNENKKTNSHEACKIFSLPPSILDGTAGDDEWALAMKVCFQPILTALESALNQDLLLASEKHPASGQGCFYFAVDTKELLKGDMLKRFQAYRLAVESNIMQIDEVRYREDLPKLGLDFIKLGLQDVLYDPKTKEVYTPNTDKTTNLNQQVEEGEKTQTDIREGLTEQKSTGSGREQIAKVSLNGAQISSILEIIQAVSIGEIEFASAVTLLITAFPFTEQEARKILGNPKSLSEKGGEQHESGDSGGQGSD